MRNPEELEYAIKDSAINSMVLMQLFDETEIDCSMIIKMLSFHVRSVEFSLQLKKDMLQAQERFIHNKLQHFLSTTSNLEDADRKCLQELSHKIATIVGTEGLSVLKKDTPHE